MGEIKSTLDLVLEKTRHLTLSSEEKQEQTQKEIEKRIKGLLQKYQDGILPDKQLQIDYEKLKNDSNLSDNNILISEIINRLNPDQDNQSLLEILEECCSNDSATIKAVINDYRDTYHKAVGTRMGRLKENLAQKYFISGSAVVPNLETDEQWRREAQEIRSGYEDQLDRVKDSLLEKWQRA
jgi:hypothetical protein